MKEEIREVVNAILNGFPGGTDLDRALLLPS